MIGNFGQLGAGFGRLGASASRKRAIELLGNATNIASLTLTSLILPDQATSEGILIKSCGNLWIEIAQRLGEDWALAFQLEPRQWEEMFAGALTKEGYEVTLTPRSGDHGRDLIAVKQGHGYIRILGSMKAYAPTHLVGRDHVDEMIGVLARDAKATKGIIATTSKFAPRIMEAPGMSNFVPSRLELRDGPALQQWLANLSE